MRLREWCRTNDLPCKFELLQFASKVDILIVFPPPAILFYFLVFFFFENVFRFPITLVRGSVVFPFPSVRVQFSVLDEDISHRSVGQEVEAGGCGRRLRKEAEAQGNI